MFSFAGLFVVLVCADMGVKQYVEDHLETGEVRAFHFPYVELRKVYNQGFVFNLLDEHPEIVRAASAAVAAALAACDANLFLQKGRRLHKTGMMLLSAGAFSNIYDRLVRGKLIDYIGLTKGPKALQGLTANLADVYVVLGAALAELTHGRGQTKK